METLQKYCLRWNNYQNNLVRVFDEMLRNENFADVTLVCNGGDRFRCHRMLLAACSKFFQEIFMSVPCEQHLVILLKDVKAMDMKHILEYMYTGEVNVEQDEISSIIRAAEELQIKGLIGEDKTGKKEDQEAMDEAPPSRSPSVQVQTMVHSSSNMHSPPHSTNSIYKNPYTNMYSKLHPNDRANMNLPMWHVPGLPLHPPPASESPSSNHFSVPSPPAMIPAYESPNVEVYHHRRKKFSSMMMSKDTPILRTVLGQGQPDSSQPVSLVVSHADTKEEHAEQEHFKKHMNTEEHLEDSQSNSDYHNEEDKHRIVIPCSPTTYPDMRLGSSGIANYVPVQKPESNKRYKQYSNNDLNGALDDVRAGMSALMAAKKHNVPSRTLYDKVKKLGIKSGTTRQVKRCSNGSPPDYIMDDRSISPRKSESDDYSINNNSSVTKAFLQHAGDDALKAMALAAAAHALQNSNRVFSPGSSQNPNLRYLPYNRLSPHSPTNSENRSVSPERGGDYDEDHVEDLSINRRQEGVIVNAMNQVSAIMNDDRLRNEDSRRSNFEETTT